MNATLALRSAMPHDVHYILCVTEQSLLDALPILSRSSVLFLDCEGRELGKHGGALSLVALGTAHAEHIFLIDALALADARTPAMRRVFNLLAAPSVRTVVWDGRMDFLELRATYRVHLHGVLDLQLAEIESRTGPVRKEDDQARIDRLGHQIGWRDAKRFRNLHALTGLSRCLVECKLGDVVSKDGMFQGVRINTMSYSFNSGGDEDARQRGLGDVDGTSSASTTSVLRGE